MAKWIKMLFVGKTSVSPRNIVLDMGPDLPQRGRGVPTFLDFGTLSYLRIVLSYRLEILHAYRG